MGFLTPAFTITSRVMIILVVLAMAILAFFFIKPLLKRFSEKTPLPKS
jgi:hypothetical protein